MSGEISRMRAAANALNKGLGILLSFLMGAMVLDVTWQVITRFVLKSPSSFTEELAGFFLIWIGLLGAGYAFYTKAHLGIDVLTYKLGGLKKKVVEILANGVILVFAVLVMMIGGLRLMGLAFALHQVSPAAGIKMGYVYSAIPLSGILIAFYSLAFIGEVWKKAEAAESRPLAPGID